MRSDVARLLVKSEVAPLPSCIPRLQRGHFALPATVARHADGEQPSSQAGLTRTNDGGTGADPIPGLGSRAAASRIAGGDLSSCACPSRRTASAATPRRRRCVPTYAASGTCSASRWSARRGPSCSRWSRRSGGGVAGTTPTARTPAAWQPCSRTSTSTRQHGWCGPSAPTSTSPTSPSRCTGPARCARSGPARAAGWRRRQSGSGPPACPRRTSPRSSTGSRSARSSPPTRPRRPAGRSCPSAAGSPTCSTRSTTRGPTAGSPRSSTCCGRPPSCARTGPSRSTRHATRRTTSTS